MYKLLVVDDEYNIRDGLSSTIQWGSIGAQVVGTAINGCDALIKMAQFSPDIVITDVNMDCMDGLELVEVLRQKYPSVKTIIVSGYDEFEYVRRALELKVFSYIMKPVRAKEMLVAVRSLIEEIEVEKKIKNRIESMEAEIERSKSVLVERFLFDLLHGNIGDEDGLAMRRDFLGLRFGSAFYACMILSIPDYGRIAREQGLKKLQGLIFGIREIVKNAMSGFELWPLSGEHGNLTLLAGCDAACEEAFGSDLVQKLERAVDDFFRLTGIPAVATVGGISRGLTGIPRSYREAALALDHSSLSDKAGVFHIGDVPATGGSRYIYPVDKEKLLLKSLTDESLDRVSEIIDGLFDDMLRQGYTWERMRVDITGLLGVASRKAMDMGVDTYRLFNRDMLDPWKALDGRCTHEEMKSWFKVVVIITMQEIRDRQASSIRSVIVKANGYLMENYANPAISLVTISEHLHLSQSYFSRMYKKETGESYVEALTRIRLERAKKLLKETNGKITEISESVGYPDSKYFCTLFKKLEGLTPVEYREV